MPLTRTERAELSFLISACRDSAADNAANPSDAAGKVDENAYQTVRQWLANHTEWNEEA